MKNELFETMRKSGKPYQSTILICGDEITVTAMQLITKEQYKEVVGDESNKPTLVQM